MRSRPTPKITEIISLIMAVITTASLGVSIPLVIEPFNDARLSSVTILDNPPLVKALQDAQRGGVHMGIHGWRHEDYQTLTPAEAYDAVEKSIQVFKEAGLIPVAFITPFGDYSMLLQSTRSAIESTGIATSLPSISSYIQTTGWGWRNMRSFDDRRYTNELQSLLERQPNYILLHAQDWNIYLKRLMEEYLQSSERNDVTIRIDDVEVNTPPEAVYDMADFLKINPDLYIAFGLIPSGTWRGGDPQIGGVRVDTVMQIYWFFFLSTTFFPFSFFVIWRVASKLNEYPTLEDPKKDGVMSVSMIVPAFNEEKNIGRCIEAMLNQDYKGEVEVLIVNDGSTDKTAGIASTYPVRLIDLKTNHGKCRALNIGINEAKGDILVFSDADSRMEGDAVRLLVDYFDEHQDVGAVAGNVFIEKYDANTLTRFQMVEYRIEQEINRHLQSLNGEVIVCPGPLFAVVKEIAAKIRFSDRTVVEDADFTIEALENYVKIEREPRARVYTEAPKSFRQWMNQRKRWWYGNLQLWRTHNKWATGNPWMILSYLSFITSTISIGLLMLLPFLFLTYANPMLMLQRGIFYTIIPIILFFFILIPLFIKEAELVLTLLPYIVVYSTIKFVIVSYVYLRYLTRRGIKLVFGPRVMEVF